MDRTIRILSIDGGGIRGVFSARILVALEDSIRAAGGPDRLCDVFHFIAGTSTGGILATGLAKPDAPMTAQQLLDFYYQEGENIFPDGSRATTIKKQASGVKALVDQVIDQYKNGSWGIKYIGIYNTVKAHYNTLIAMYEQLRKPIYEGRQIEAVLKAVLSETMLSQVERCHLLVTAYDMLSRDPYLFKSWSARAQGDNAKPDFALWQVARSTSAAPVYFPPAAIDSIPSLAVVKPQSFAMVDGGVFANNPGMCALAAAQRMYPGARYRMVSVGTGQMAETRNFDRDADWGALPWAGHLLNVLMDGVTDTVDYQLRETLGTGYTRFQASLAAGSPPPDQEMDNPQKPNLDALVRLAESVIARNKGVFDALGRELAAQRDPIGAVPEPV
ncbi:patatin-like phospholipase family protein [Azospirillum halopraeferens]|uniref:patatin-like phospholipase family protein n=1 Tax=Azospirillum halopraeferens TaxID=34010 RepID=UPI0003F598E2|nr:patatin-like phospholipase family protein [Azospirillum halopraeferens]